ncbi:hypothetical protein VKT23_008528 [Stygiomarasmius scandens]|uniref:F-box domain-containing protein n=1 Tax=Marasmiellus scandens TaxID=2682957 RepID=A0ABR1JLC8_9AGAR
MVVDEDVLPHFIVETPALSVSQTCVHWRKLAKSIPSLWSDMLLSLTHDKMSLAKLVETYLLHSGSAPLTLFIEAWEPDGYQYATTLSACGSTILKSLINHANRWRKIKFALSIRIFRDFDWSPHCINCDILEEVMIPDDTDVLGLEMSRFRRLLSHCPRLYKLYVDNGFSSSLLQSLPCLQLTAVYITSCGVDMDCDDICRLLRRCPNLSYLYIQPDFHEAVVGPSLASSVTCSRLRSLTVSLNEPDVSSHNSVLICTNIFHSITASALDTLRLFGDKDPENTEKQLKLFLDSILSFLQRSSCRLQSLQLVGDFITTEELLKLLQQLPSLVHFSIEGASRRFGLLEALTVSFDQSETGPQAVLLPNLIEIDLGISLDCEDIPIYENGEVPEGVAAPVKQEGHREEHSDVTREGGLTRIQGSAQKVLSCEGCKGVEAQHRWETSRSDGDEETFAVTNEEIAGDNGSEPTKKPNGKRETDKILTAAGDNRNQTEDIARNKEKRDAERNEVSEKQGGNLVEQKLPEGVIIIRSTRNDDGHTANAETQDKHIPESRGMVEEPQGNTRSADSVQHAVDKVCNMIQSRRYYDVNQMSFPCVAKFILGIKAKSDSEQRWAQRFSSNLGPRLQSLLGRDGYIMVMVLE